MHHRTGYTEILKRLIRTENAPTGLSSRMMQFKVDMLENGCTPKDMPMFEELFTEV